MPQVTSATSLNTSSSHDQTESALQMVRSHINQQAHNSLITNYNLESDHDDIGQQFEKRIMFAHSNNNSLINESY